MVNYGLGRRQKSKAESSYSSSSSLRGTNASMASSASTASISSFSDALTDDSTFSNDPYFHFSSDQQDALLEESRSTATALIVDTLSGFDKWRFLSMTSKVQLFELKDDATDQVSSMRTDDPSELALSQSHTLLAITRVRAKLDDFMRIVATDKRDKFQNFLACLHEEEVQHADVFTAFGNLNSSSSGGGNSNNNSSSDLLSSSFTSNSSFGSSKGPRSNGVDVEQYAIKYYSLKEPKIAKSKTSTRNGMAKKFIRKGKTSSSSRGSSPSLSSDNGGLTLCVGEYATIRQGKIRASSHQKAGNNHKAIDDHRIGIVAWHSVGDPQVTRYCKPIASTTGSGFAVTSRSFAQFSGIVVYPVESSVPGESLLEVVIKLSCFDPQGVSLLKKQAMMQYLVAYRHLENALLVLRLHDSPYLSSSAWVKSESRKCCNVCQQSFPSFRRKHHCRLCGEVICSKCSSMHAIKLAKAGKVSFRICDACVHGAGDGIKRLQSSKSAGSGPEGEEEDEEEEEVHEVDSDLQPIRRDSDPLAPDNQQEKQQESEPVQQKQQQQQHKSREPSVRVQEQEEDFLQQQQQQYVLQKQSVHEQPQEQQYQPRDPSVRKPHQPQYQPREPSVREPHQPQYQPREPSVREPHQPQYQPREPSVREPHQPQYQPREPSVREPHQPQYQPREPSVREQQLEQYALRKQSVQEPPQQQAEEFPEEEEEEPQHEYHHQPHHQSLLHKQQLEQHDSRHQQRHHDSESRDTATKLQVQEKPRASTASSGESELYDSRGFLSSNVTVTTAASTPPESPLSSSPVSPSTAVVHNDHQYYDSQQDNDHRFSEQSLRDFHDSEYALDLSDLHLESTIKESEVFAIDEEEDYEDDEEENNNNVTRGINNKYGNQSNNNGNATGYVVSYDRLDEEDDDDDDEEEDDDDQIGEMIGGYRNDDDDDTGFEFHDSEVGINFSFEEIEEFNDDKYEALEEIQEITTTSAAMVQRNRLLDELRRTRLMDYDILDSAREQSFDLIAKQAAQFMSCSLASISFVDDRREFVKAASGDLMLRVGGGNLHELPKQHSLAAHIVQRCAAEDLGMVLVLDARHDEALSTNLFVYNAPYLRFVVGIPVRTRDGVVLGALVVADDRPRGDMTPTESKVLRDFAEQINDLMEERWQRNMYQRRVAPAPEQIQQTLQSLLSQSYHTGQQLRQQTERQNFHRSLPLPLPRQHQPQQQVHHPQYQQQVHQPQYQQQPHQPQYQQHQPQYQPMPKYRSNNHQQQHHQEPPPGRLTMQGIEL